MTLWAALAEMPTLWLSAATLLGLVVGSFLNVVIHRLPLMMEREWRAQCAELEGRTPEDTSPFNLVTPRSRCPKCGHLITAVENIPLLSYIVQRGRCRHCGTGISIQYPLVEAATALLSGLLAWQLGPGWAAVAALLLTWALVALTMIDYHHQLLPDDITLPLLWLGIGLALFGVFTDLRSSVLGAMAGYLSLWSVYWLFKLLTGKEGMGYGDFKLLAALGAWLGWQYLITIIILSSIVGAVVGSLLIVMRGHGRSQPIPFGPFLAGAGWLTLLWGAPLQRLYLSWFGIV